MVQANGPLGVVGLVALDQGARGTRIIEVIKWAARALWEDEAMAMAEYARIVDDEAAAERERELELRDGYRLEFEREYAEEFARLNAHYNFEDSDDDSDTEDYFTDGSENGVWL